MRRGRDTTAVPTHEPCVEASIGEWPAACAEGQPVRAGEEDAEASAGAARERPDHDAAGQPADAVGGAAVSVRRTARRGLAARLIRGVGATASGSRDCRCDEESDGR
jgi:hypothetical protein